MTDEQRVLEYLQKHKRITSLTAFREMGNTRVGARICDLRKKGHNIKTDMVYTRRADGTPTHWAVYTLEE